MKQRNVTFRQKAEGKMNSNSFEEVRKSPENEKQMEGKQAGSRSETLIRSGHFILHKHQCGYTRQEEALFINTLVTHPLN